MGNNFHGGRGAWRGGHSKNFGKWSHTAVFYYINSKGVGSGTEFGHRREFKAGDWSAGGSIRYGRVFECRRGF